jgi:insertion element IS1 protein InsB
MIQEMITHPCPQCGSSQLVKNGKTVQGKQKYHCRTCGTYGTLQCSVRYTPERKAEILRAYHERSSLRGWERTFGVARQTVAKWLRQEADALPDSPPVAEAATPDVLELDELWSFVGSKKTNAGSG